MLYTNKKYDGIGFGATTGSAVVSTTEKKEDDNSAVIAILAAGNAVSSMIGNIWGAQIQYNYTKDTLPYRQGTSQNYGYPSSVGGTSGSTSSTSFLGGKNMLIFGGIGIVLLGAVLLMRRKAS